MIVYCAEITLVRENPNKIWFSSYLFIPLTMSKILPFESTKEKIGVFFLYFTHLFVPL